MANQSQALSLPPPRAFTRTDFTALRAFVQRIEPATIARLYYDADTAPHAVTPSAMADYLRTMCDGLVQLALINGSPALAAHLRESIRSHGSAKLTAVTCAWSSRPRNWPSPSRWRYTVWACGSGRWSRSA